MKLNILYILLVISTLQIFHCVDVIRKIKKHSFNKHNLNVKLLTLSEQDEDAPSQIHGGILENKFDLNLEIQNSFVTSLAQSAINKIKKQLETNEAEFMKNLNSNFKGKEFGKVNEGPVGKVSEIGVRKLNLQSTKLELKEGLANFIGITVSGVTFSLNFQQDYKTLLVPFTDYLQLDVTNLSLGFDLKIVGQKPEIGRINLNYESGKLYRIQKEGTENFVTKIFIDASNLVTNNALTEYMVKTVIDFWFERIAKPSLQTQLEKAFNVPSVPLSAFPGVSLVFDYGQDLTFGSENGKMVLQIDLSIKGSTKVHNEIRSRRHINSSSRQFRYAQIQSHAGGNIQGHLSSKIVIQACQNIVPRIDIKSILNNSLKDAEFSALTAKVKNIRTNSFNMNDVKCQLLNSKSSQGFMLDLQINNLNGQFTLNKRLLVGEGTDLAIKFQIQKIHLKINFDQIKNKVASSIEQVGEIKFEIASDGGIADQALIFAVEKGINYKIADIIQSLTPLIDSQFNEILQKKYVLNNENLDGSINVLIDSFPKFSDRHLNMELKAFFQ